MLLVILNWFFHKTYWTGHRPACTANRPCSWARGLRAVARAGHTGLSSVYREGFETVLFVQALVLATDVATVLTGG
jgi:high-affinity iron transporter